MKKRSLLAAVLLLCLLLSACSSSPKEPGVTGNLDPKKPVTVTLWHYYVGENQQMLDTAVAEFNQTVGIEKGVIVESVAMGSIAELETEVTNAAKGVINAQQMPQIFSSYPDKALEIDALSQVVDLNAYFTEEEKSLFVADFLADGLLGGKMLLLPIVKSTELLYVNATTWNEFATAQGLGEDAMATWESLYDTAKAYYEWSGKAMMGFDSLANYVIVGARQLGLKVIDAESGEGGQAVLDRDVLRRVFDLYYKGMGLGYFDAIGRFRSDDIKSGDLIAYVGSSSSAAYFPTWIEKDNTQMPIDFLPLTYPVFEGGEAYATQQGAGMCVAKSTPAQQEGAVVFLKWFTSPEENIRFAMTTGYLPVQMAAYGSETLGEVLGALRSGEQSEKNVAGVYDISLHQITESNTYAAKPFDGSYGVRSILQSTILDAGEEAAAVAAPLRAQQKTEAEILEALDADAAFENWLATVYTMLTEAGIKYVQ